VELEGGTAAERQALERALCVEPGEEASMAHLHGFHSYPARLHPDTASALIEAFSKPGQAVLDPFCGSGTVLLEALRLGRRALGVDANPLAVELAWLKTRAPRASFLGELEAAARQVAAHAEARRKARAGATRRYPEEDRALFAPHVLLELDGLRDGIARAGTVELGRALGLALSSILTKVSQRAGDSSGRIETKRIAGGYPIKLFSRKASELVRRAAELDRLLPAKVLHSHVELGDARHLGFLRAGSIDLIVSSPPYAGVYDYFEQHKARLRWLGLSAGRFERTEIGSRRQGRQRPAAALDAFRHDFAACLSEMARVLAPRGRAALIVADSVFASRVLYADELVAELAPQAGLTLVARASQRRPHFHQPTRQAFRQKPRSEHLILLAASDSPARAPAARRAPPSRDRRSGGRGS
jgi:SAM-dependent methyltransferase